MGLTSKGRFLYRFKVFNDQNLDLENSKINFTLKVETDENPSKTDILENVENNSQNEISKISSEGNLQNFFCLNGTAITKYFNNNFNNYFNSNIFYRYIIDPIHGPSSKITEVYLVENYFLLVFELEEMDPESDNQIYYQIRNFDTNNSNNIINEKLFDSFTKGAIYLSNYEFITIQNLGTQISIKAYTIDIQKSLSPALSEKGNTYDFSVDKIFPGQKIVQYGRDFFFPASKDGKTYILYFRWSEAENTWNLDEEGSLKIEIRADFLIDSGIDYQSSTGLISIPFKNIDGIEGNGKIMVYKLKTCFLKNRNQSVDQQCLECTGPLGNQCTACSPGKVISTKFGCAERCESGFIINTDNNKCDPCGNAICTSCDLNSQCNACKDGYLLNSINQECEECMNGCELCQDSSSCSKCKDGFYADSQRVCQSCPGDNCKQCDSNGCNTCIDSNNYHMIYDSQINKQICEEHNACYNGICNNCVDNKCTECRDGYRLQNGECVRCPENCKECDENGCTKCHASYYLFPEGCRSCNDELCESCGNQYCYQCKSGLLLSSGKCYPCPKGCLSCDRGYCHGCKPGFIDFRQNSNHISQCTIPCPDANCKSCSISTLITDNIEIQYTNCDACKQEYAPKEVKVGNNKFKICEKCEIENCRGCQLDSYVELG